MAKLYRSPEAAQRAAAIVERDVPGARVKVDGASLDVFTRDDLPAAQRRRLEALGIVPEALPPIERSTASQPIEIAREIVRRYMNEGRLDDRKGAIDEIIEAGVAKNTAATYYARIREELGIPLGVQATRRLAKREKAPRRLIREEVFVTCDLYRENYKAIPAAPDLYELLPHVAKSTLRRYVRLWREQQKG